jgi:hypothetical protein
MDRFDRYRQQININDVPQNLMDLVPRLQMGYWG